MLNKKFKKGDLIICIRGNAYMYTGKNVVCEVVKTHTKDKYNRIGVKIVKRLKVKIVNYSVTSEIVRYIGECHIFDVCSEDFKPYKPRKKKEINDTSR